MYKTAPPLPPDGGVVHETPPDPSVVKTSPEFPGFVGNSISLFGSESASVTYKVLPSYAKPEPVSIFISPLFSVSPGPTLTTPDGPSGPGIPCCPSGP